MPGRGLLARVLTVSALVVAGALAVVGGLALRGSGLAAVLLAAGVAACLGGGIARESAGHDRRGAVEAAWRSAAWTVGVLLLLAGVTALTGGRVTAGLVVAVGVVLLGIWGVRAHRRRPAAPTWRPAPPAPGQLSRVLDDADPLPAVGGLTTPELGQEWLRTGRALQTEHAAAAREHLVRRRQETLDELERRDPEGFARWTAGGALDSDPAAFVQGDPAPGLG